MWLGEVRKDRFKQNSHSLLETRITLHYIQMNNQHREPGIPAISKPQSQGLHLLTSQSIIFSARLQTLPLLKQKSRAIATDPAGSSGPLQPQWAWPLTVSALSPDSHSQTFFSSCWTMPVCFLLLSIFNFVKFHYITCSKSHPSDSYRVCLLYSI